jgi:hypothetical protein
MAERPSCVAARQFDWRIKLAWRKDTEIRTEFTELMDRRFSSKRHFQKILFFRLKIPLCGSASPR